MPVTTDQITLEPSARNRDEMVPNMARRLWRVVRAVLFMLRKGVPKRKLAMDLNLLLHRGKIAGKAFSKIMNTHGHQDKAVAASGVPPPQSFSWRAGVDPALAVVYDPRGSREVEFSCSNTPSYRSFHLIPTGNKHNRRNNRRTHRGANGDQPGWYNYDAADIARVFEVLNNDSEKLLTTDDDEYASVTGTEQPSPLALVATPSPALWASFSLTPSHVRQLRVTDSPFPLRDDDDASSGGGQVDLEAEEFIKKFYEQLHKQQNLAGATPDYGCGGYAWPVTGMA